ncbi:MAG: hypothetical protein JW944_01040 [Deltaproteobacteria bacterium]|nr:hypothetical protein [Deltaproteobacteria bacterium]
MIRILFMSICIILLSIEAYAQDIIFPDELLNEIRVTETDKEGGAAIISDGDGNQEEISFNDVISIDGMIVVEIEKGYITVKRGDTKTRMLLELGF